MPDFTTSISCWIWLKTKFRILSCLFTYAHRLHCF